MSGGYFGTMEAVCGGAAKVKGAVIEGLLCPTAFPGRSLNGNGFLTASRHMSSLGQRIAAFTEPSPHHLFLHTLQQQQATVSAAAGTAAAGGDSNSVVAAVASTAATPGLGGHGADWF